MAAELTNRRCGGSIPASAGVGLRAPHYAAFIDGAPAVRWLEVHSENYFCAGGLPHSTLAKIRERYPMSLHGVGLSIASTDPLDRAHLKKLKDVIARYEPGLVSEHLSWGSVNGLHLNDLLPVPYSLETLGLVVERVDAIQAYLGRQILIENISSYMQFAVAEMTEATFFAELVRRSGCGVLLDVNNLYVNESNIGQTALDFIGRIPREAVGEIHLAGHSIQRYEDREILVDTHDAPICSGVWTLYEAAIERFGRRPTLIEWDSSLPPLDVLIGEAARAERIMERFDALAA